MTLKLVAIYRSVAYSPGRHSRNDAAIMDTTTAVLAQQGWSVEPLGEGDVEAGIIPDADLYLNMCQGEVASTRLLEVELQGARILNRPSAVLGCHRHRLVRTLSTAPIAFPITRIVSTQRAPRTDELPPGDLWIKRGDVHAQEAADVVRTSAAGAPAAIAAFASRGVSQVAVQQHVDGTVLKFYGVRGAGLFHAFREDGKAVDGDTVELRALRTMAFDAADAVGLDIFGGDAVVASRSKPVLVDLNDWPSFAPVREQAARAIAQLVALTTMARSTR